MIFGLLNTKVTDIKCGSHHCVVVGAPRNATAANMVGQYQHIGTGGYHARGYSYAGQYGFGSQSNTVSRNKQMVFSWGCNRNH